MNNPIRLTPADHTLIHACGTLLCHSGCYDAQERDEQMVQAILRKVRHDASDGILALQPFIAAAPDLAAASAADLRGYRYSKGYVLWDYHRHKMAHAWDMIRERYADA